MHPYALCKCINHAIRTKYHHHHSNHSMSVWCVLIAHAPRWEISQFKWNSLKIHMKPFTPCISYTYTQSISTHARLFQFNYANTSPNKLNCIMLLKITIECVLLILCANIQIIPKFHKGTHTHVEQKSHKHNRFKLIHPLNIFIAWGENTISQKSTLIRDRILCCIHKTESIESNFEQLRRIATRN